MFIPQTPIPGSKQLFEVTPLTDTLNQDNPLVILAKKVNWNFLVDYFTKFYDPRVGRRILPIRLMIGMLLLKFMFDLSDEDVISNWQENIYYQAFTGAQAFVKKAPCSPSQLTLFRQRIKIDGCEMILAESVRIHGKKILEKYCITDTTVQEKNITYPTDSKLILKAIKLMLKIGEFLNINFRSKFVRETKDLKSKINFGKSQLKNDQKIKYIERLRTIAKTLFTVFNKNLPEYSKKFYLIKKLCWALNKVITQTKKEKNKVYSIHEPQTKCIIKGKAGKKFEFGSKVSLVISKKSKIILGILNFTENLFDGDTLAPAIEQLSRLHNGYKPESLTGDRGYRGRHEVKGVKILTPYDKTNGILGMAHRLICKLLRARTTIEPIIGHLKEDHRLSRNRLKGVLGDRINPLLAGAAFNLLKYARLDYNKRHKPPKTLASRLACKNKYHGLPLWKPKPTLF